MGDRMQRAKGKTEEITGHTKKDVGRATGDRSTEASGAEHELKGKARNALGKASSAVKRGTR